MSGMRHRKFTITVTIESEGETFTGTAEGAGYRLQACTVASDAALLAVVEIERRDGAKGGRPMTARYRVVVEGPPVEAEVSWEQVREYLLAKGWERRDDGYEVWDRGTDTLTFNPHTTLKLERTIYWIATYEERYVADVLRDIATVEAAAKAGAPTVLTPESLRAALAEGRTLGAELKRRLDRMHSREPLPPEAPVKNGNAPLTEEELAGILVLADVASDEPDDERDCRMCGKTMAGSSSIDEEPTTLCDACTHHTAAELGGAVHHLLATVRAQTMSVGLNACALDAAQGELAVVRAAVGARKDEATVDAVRRVVAEGKAWRNLAQLRGVTHFAHAPDFVCGMCEFFQQAAEQFRALGIDPDTGDSNG